MKRDLRLDFLRGVVLLLIVMDHPRDDQPITSYVTDWAFCDAAHAFIFLSGLVCGMVYSRLIAERGLRTGIVKAVRRALQVYAAHIITLVLAVFIVVGAYALFGLDPNIFGMRPFYEQPVTAITNALALTYMPSILDVLKMYILLLLALPWMVALYQHSRVTAVGISLVVYAFAQDSPDVVLPTYPEGFEWFWNPLGWQLLFFGGVWIGIEKAAGRFRMVYHWSLVMLSLAVFAYMFWAWRREVANLSVIDWGWIDRTRLGPAHLANFAAIAYLVAWSCRPDLRIWKAMWVQPVIRCGQLSLAVYCFGVIVDYLISIVLHRTTNPWVEYGMLVLAAATVLTAPWCFQCAAACWRLVRRSVAPAPVPVPIPVPVEVYEHNRLPLPNTVMPDAIAAVATLRLQPVSQAPHGHASNGHAPRAPDHHRERNAVAARNPRRPVAINQAPHFDP